MGNIIEDKTPIWVNRLVDSGAAIEGGIGLCHSLYANNPRIPAAMREYNLICLVMHITRMDECYVEAAKEGYCFLFRLPPEFGVRYKSEDEGPPFVKFIGREGAPLSPNVVVDFFCTEGEMGLWMRYFKGEFD